MVAVKDWVIAPLRRTLTRKPDAGPIGPPRVESCVIQRMKMVTLSPAVGEVVDVHTPMVRAGSVGVADEEAPAEVLNSLIPWPPPSPGDWRVRRANSTTASVSVNSVNSASSLKGQGARKNVCADMSSVSRRARRPGAPDALPA